MVTFRVDWNLRHVAVTPTIHRMSVTRIRDARNSLRELRKCGNALYVSGLSFRDQVVKSNHRMDISCMTNPYEPSLESEVAKPGKPYLKSRSKIAKLSWQIPLCGLVLTIAINDVAKPFAIVGAIIFIGSVVVGLVISLIGIVFSFSYSRVARHAVGGLILNSLLVLALFSMFGAVSQANKAVIRVQEEQQAAERFEDSTSEP